MYRSIRLSLIVPPYPVLRLFLRCTHLLSTLDRMRIAALLLCVVLGVVSMSSGEAQSAGGARAPIETEPKVGGTKDVTGSNDERLEAASKVTGPES